MPLILHAGIEREHPVVDSFDGHAGRERAGVEDVEAVGQPERGVAGGAGRGVGEAFLAALRAGEAEPRRDLVVHLPVAVARPAGRTPSSSASTRSRRRSTSVRSSCVAVMPSELELLPTMALYQRPGVTSPWAQTPYAKYGRKNSSAITRSWPSQYGCEPCSERVPGCAVDAGVEAEPSGELVAERRRRSRPGRSCSRSRRTTV